MVSATFLIVGLVHHDWVQALLLGEPGRFGAGDHEVGGALLVEEAGGVVARLDGGAYEVSAPDILAAAPGVARELMAECAAHVEAVAHGGASRAAVTSVRRHLAIGDSPALRKA